MKNLFHKVTNTMKKVARKVRYTMIRLTASVRPVLANNAGEGYVDTAIKILLAVVLGALLLAGLYALFGDTVLPTLTRRIQEMFNYAG